jgi:hypothetical protein
VWGPLLIFYADVELRFVDVMADCLFAATKRNSNAGARSYGIEDGVRRMRFLKMNEFEAKAPLENIVDF